MRIFAIYGAGGCGRGVMPVARQMLELAEPDRLVFVDDSAAVATVNQHEVLTFDAFCALEADERKIAIAVADPVSRRLMAQRCDDAGLDYFSVTSEIAVIMDHVSIGVGSLISPFVTLTSNIKIGRHFHANLYSYVEHDCLIGDFVTFAPGVRCNGNVHIGRGAYIGSGAIIRQGTPARPLLIGTDATIGMGAVVTKDVPAGVTVVGNPARQLLR
jgi:sugar O-acyltransferase (sialic acid O-acetyltransferase NeuD family)